MLHPKFNPETDLKIERVVDVPREKVWRAWTEPKHVMAWFTPKPWQTTACEIDLRAGGRFYTLMRSPEGESFPTEACYLEVLKNDRLVWTDIMTEGFRPAGEGFHIEVGGFTVILVLETVGANQTRYTAYVLHKGKAQRDKHDAQGFSHGWNAALDQLVEHCKQAMAE
jgi:uncharacterized protein YndB with AHSA1/START domain